MGCDIHICTEIKKLINGKEVWINADNWRIDPYAEKGEPKYLIKEIYSDRNYSLFSLLAGVRDYSEKTIPVSQPKGLPDDISPQTEKEAKRWGCDGHTHSWLTLLELKEFQKKEPKVTHSGLVSPETFRAYKERREFPTEWCQGTNQEDWVRLEWTEKDNSLQPIIDELERRMKDELWIFKDDYDKELAKRARIVFWFDN